MHEWAKLMATCNKLCKTVMINMYGIDIGREKVHQQKARMHEIWGRTVGLRCECLSHVCFLRKSDFLFSHSPSFSLVLLLFLAALSIPIQLKKEGSS